MKAIGGLLIILTFISCNDTNHKSDKKETMNEQKEIKRDNAVINYEITGAGDTTLLFVHGSYIDQSYWKDQVSFFSPRYKVVTLDLPGHGKSGKERAHWSLKGFAEDVNAIIRELNLENVILIGHSMGGDVNLIAATSNPGPIAGFIAIDIFKNAATPPTPEIQQQVDTILQRLKTDFANTNEQYVRMVLVTPQTPREITDRVVQDYRNAYEPMGLETMPEIFTLHETERELLPQLKHKLYLINVDYMPTNEEALKKHAVNGYELRHMTGTSHYPMLENPDTLNRSLQEVIHAL